MKIPEILLIQSERVAGNLGLILSTIGKTGAIVEHLSVVKRDQNTSTWEITLIMDEQLEFEVIREIDALPTASVIGHSDRIFDRHRGGKIKTVPSIGIASQQVLRDIYTPGVARVCLAIRDDPAKAHDFTNRGNTVAIVTDGTAILGLGNIGPLAGLPVMEGKAALFSKLAAISGVPVLINVTEPEAIVRTVKSLEPTFGAIQLEDIKAPQCFEIEKRLVEELEIPVLHDDQHGTAIVTLATLINCTRRLGRDLKDMTIGQIGLGAAGIGISRLLIVYGVKKMLGNDVNPNAVAMLEDLGGEGRELDEIMAEADVVIATTGIKGLISPDKVREGQVILALSNPDPEIDPRQALDAGAAFAADGKSINNVLGFPGLFRGVLDARVRRFTDAMFFAAAEKLAELAPADELLPDALDPGVHAEVAKAVAGAAIV